MAPAAAHSIVTFHNKSPTHLHYIITAYQSAFCQETSNKRQRRRVVKSILSIEPDHFKWKMLSVSIWNVYRSILVDIGIAEYCYSSFPSSKSTLRAFDVLNVVKLEQGCQTYGQRVDFAKFENKISNFLTFRYFVFIHLIHLQGRGKTCPQFVGGVSVQRVRITTLVTVMCKL